HVTGVQTCALPICPVHVPRQLAHHPPVRTPFPEQLHRADVGRDVALLVAFQHPDRELQCTQPPAHAASPRVGRANPIITPRPDTAPSTSGAGRGSSSTTRGSAPSSHRDGCMVTASGYRRVTASMIRGGSPASAASHSTVVPFGSSSAYLRSTHRGTSSPACS